MASTEQSLISLPAALIIDFSGANIATASRKECLVHIDLLPAFAQKLAPAILLVFVALSSLEAVIDSFLNKGLYELNDSIENFAMFFLNKMAGGAGGALLFAVLSALAAGVPWKMSGHWSFAITFVVVDFLYFVQHYCMHRFDWLATFHVVHHTSEKYNFTTAVRANIFLPLITPFFYAPAVLLGCDIWSIIISFALVQTYQLLLHTQLVPPLGPLEGVLNTPSAHRVHHGDRTEEYHSNLGGVLMIWDRLLSTYLPEERTITYGIEGMPPERFIIAQLAPVILIIQTAVRLLKIKLPEPLLNSLLCKGIW